MTMWFLIWSDDFYSVCLCCRWLEENAVIKLLKCIYIIVYMLANCKCVNQTVWISVVFWLERFNDDTE